jgi:hypothetical protein
MASAVDPDRAWTVTLVPRRGTTALAIVRAVVAAMRDGLKLGLRLPDVGLLPRQVNRPFLVELSDPGGRGLTVGVHRTGIAAAPPPGWELGLWSSGTAPKLRGHIYHDDLLLCLGDLRLVNPDLGAPNLAPELRLEMVARGSLESTALVEGLLRRLASVGVEPLGPGAASWRPARFPDRQPADALLEEPGRRYEVRFPGYWHAGTLIRIDHFQGEALRWKAVRPWPADDAYYRPTETCSLTRDGDRLHLSLWAEGDKDGKQLDFFCRGDGTWE